MIVRIYAMKVIEEACAYLQYSLIIETLVAEERVPFLTVKTLRE